MPAFNKFVFTTQAGSKDQVPEVVTINTRIIGLYLLLDNLGTWALVALATTYACFPESTNIDIHDLYIAN